MPLSRGAKKKEIDRAKQHLDDLEVGLKRAKERNESESNIRHYEMAVENQKQVVKQLESE